MVPDMTAPTGVQKVEINGADTNGILYDVDGSSVTAFAGSLFNPDDPQHRIGSDAMRYAIAIQHSRDIGDYQAADKKRDFASSGLFRVATSGEGTTIHIG